MNLILMRYASYEVHQRTPMVDHVHLNTSTFFPSMPDLDLILISFYTEIFKLASRRLRELLGIKSGLFISQVR